MPLLRFTFNLRLFEGKHLRHARDHFDLLLDGVCSPAPHEFSYDKRSRNTPMETSRASALEALEASVSRLQEIVPKYDLDEPLILDAVTPYLQAFKSTFGREVCQLNILASHSSCVFFANSFGLLRCMLSTIGLW